MKKSLFFLIIFIAFTLRFWNLGGYPALNADEAALGYNAYSLIKTGKDEHANPFPIHFQSFNDYKPGFYVYLAIPFVWLFGLNEWAVRIPGALAGVGTVIILYWLIHVSFPNCRKFSILNFQFSLPELSAFLLAISPWHIHFSRGAWEVNVATFFIILGVYFFLVYMKKEFNDANLFRFKFLLFSLICFVLSLYTYHASRVIVPLLVFGLAIFFRKILMLYWKKLIFPFALSVFLLIPLIIDFFGPAGISRASGVGIFADPGPIARVNEQRGEHFHPNSFWAMSFHNKYVNYFLAFLQNYVDHFHGEFLFLSGDDIQRNKVPETGLLYGFELLFIIIGLLQIVNAKSIFSLSRNKNLGIILCWLVVSPFAAALTFQSPHALRAQNMVVPLTIISSIGFYSIVNWIYENKNKIYFGFGCLLLICVLCWSLFRYLHMYYKHMSYEYPYSSQYGVKELVDYLRENHKDKKIVITNFYDQPYILFLFYLKYDPYVFQNNHDLTPRDNFGFSTVSAFDRFIFEPIDFYKTALEYPDSIIIGSPKEIPSEANIIKRIYGSNNFLYFLVVAN
ncbi:MAG: hypothetical protein N2558_00570 [Patescibacteria group bacterium]|nr:hypothetical protein [Patescibacteria group bacterium]